MRKQLGRGWLGAVSLLAVGLVCGLLAASPAWADTIGYQINQPNAALVGFAPPYAEVSVNRTDTTHATITFTRDNGYLIGGAQAADVNVNATAFTVTGLACSGGGCVSPGDLSSGGASNVSIFGVFNATIDVFDGASHAATTISFILTNTGGTWLTAADVLINNAAGFLAAAHIFAGCTGITGITCVATGFAGNGPPLQQEPVPEPATLLLLGSGLVGLGGGALKRRWAARRVA